jgi:hypothetical protein
VGTLAQAALVSRAAEGDGASTAPAATAEVHGAHPTVSDDGRWVVYEGLPVDDTVGANGVPRMSTVYLRDRTPGPDDLAVVELTAASDDIRSGDSVRPVISGDGCAVVVVTELAYDLFRDDDAGSRWDVYRLVLPHCGGTPGDWELVSTVTTDTDGTTASDSVVPTETPAVSAAGSLVAYTHLSPAAKSSLLQVSVVDLAVPLGEEGRTTTVAGTPPVAPTADDVSYVGQRHPDVSGNGRYVVFASDARSDRLVADWVDGPADGGPALSQVYVWDRENTDPAAAVTLVSTASFGAAATPAAGGAHSPVISASGRYIAFESPSADLAGGAELPLCTPTCPAQIYRFDQLDGVLALVSRVPGDVGESAGPATPVVAADAGGSQAAISADGTQVAFVTRSRTLSATTSDAGVEPDDGDVVVAAVDLGTMRRISTAADGVTPLDAVNAHPDLSGSGHVVVFDTLVGADLPTDRILSGSAVVGGRVVALVERPADLLAASLDVGTVLVGLAGPEWYVAVRNNGPSTFLPATVTSSNPQFAASGGTCALQVPVIPGESCTVHVILTPTAPGPVTGTITVSEAVVGGSSITVDMAGAGGTPDLRATPAGADFTTAVVGAAAPTIAFDVENVGFQPVTITSLTFGGRNAGDFSVASTSCPGSVVNPMTSCSVEVAFTPTDAGYRSATLLVGADAGQYTSVLLTGTGRRDTKLDVSDTRIRAGEPVGVGGTGFPAGATITVGWADGKGEVVAVLADASGSFLVVLPTRPSERGGERTVVAQVGDLSARADVEVLRRSSGSPTGLPAGS